MSLALAGRRGAARTSRPPTTATAAVRRTARRCRRPGAPPSANPNAVRHGPGPGACRRCCSCPVRIRDSGRSKPCVDGRSSNALLWAHHCTRGGAWGDLLLFLCCSIAARALCRFPVFSISPPFLHFFFSFAGFLLFWGGSVSERACSWRRGPRPYEHVPPRGLALSGALPNALGSSWSGIVCHDRRAPYPPDLRSGAGDL